MDGQGGGSVSFSHHVSVSAWRLECFLVRTAVLGRDADGRRHKLGVGQADAAVGRVEQGIDFAQVELRVRVLVVLGVLGVFGGRQISRAEPGLL